MNNTVASTQSKKSINPLKWVPSAYFAMGLPFVVLNMVCVLMFKGMGIADSQIALWTSVIMFPWTLKFIWSPLLELAKTKKSIVVATQIISGVGFGLIALALHMPHFFAICIAILSVVALSGASHDVALDGLYMAELDSKEQAKFIGWQGAFYNIAKLVATGLFVYLAGTLKNYFETKTPGLEEAEYYAPAWGIIMVGIATLLIVLGIYHSRTLPPSAQTHDSNSNVGSEIWEVIRTFFQKKYIGWYILFIILYRFGEGFVMKIVPLFLKASRDLGDRKSVV